MNDLYKTPQKRVLALSSKASPPSTPSITVPTSPYLEKIGYGTGVSVFLMERNAAKGVYKSPWAVKKVSTRFANSEQDFTSRLLHEANILKKLSHPNIIGFRAVGKSQDGTHCLAMERGECSLTDLIEERLEDTHEPFSALQISLVGRDIAKALSYLHEAGLLHGDVKSGNVLIFGDFQVAKLCDFGVSVSLINGQCPHGSYTGTEVWSGPEIFDEDELPLTEKADIYPYGCTLWEMLALTTPHGSVDDSHEEWDEDVYITSLGTRPPLPSRFDLGFGNGYRQVMQIFVACTEPLPIQRPSARELVDMWLYS